MNARFLFPKLQLEADARCLAPSRLLLPVPK
jgi:hypothetical protein